MGRMPQYRPEMAERIKELCVAGYTNAEIAKDLEISETTFYAWKLKYPELNDALKEWKAYADNIVENSLFKSAKGFWQEQEKVVSSGGRVFVQKYLEYYPPSNTAQIFWLKNRLREDWQDRRESDVTVKGDADEGNSLAKLANSIAALADKLAGGDDDKSD